MRRIVGSLGVLPIILLVLVTPALAARPSTAFTGAWEGIDPGDGSNVAVYIAGESTTQVLYTDDNATQACDGAASPRFVSILVGKVQGSEMYTVMQAAKCGTEPRPFFHGLEIAWGIDDGGNADPSDDVLYNNFGEEYTRSS